MIHCNCQTAHPRRHIVLTGGPGAGKTAVLELVRQYFCQHVKVLPEAAGILFGGGFPREGSTVARMAAQRAIFYVQRELERMVEDEGHAIVLCDRGTIDSLAYWPGRPEDFWATVGTTREVELARYDAVIHLRPPGPEGYQRNGVRLESVSEAAVLDRRIQRAWDGHPRRVFVESTPNFLDKALRAIQLLRAELPECCHHHGIPGIDTPPQARAGGA